MVSMEAGRACGYRDDNARLPTLSLGLSSVRLIVNKFELQHTRVTPDYQCEVVKYDPNIDETYEYDDSPLDKTRGRVLYHVAQSLSLAFSKCIPSVSFGNFGVLAVTSGLFAPRMISYLVLYPFCRLVFGTLYPAYASYKAVRTKNLKEYVKWMMYWIVFALFTCTETFTDVFLSWFPFYYEVKIVLVLWLLSPATKGSSILYRKFVHPALCRREQEIDEYIAKAKDQGYHTVLNLGTKGVNYATTVIMQTAIKGGGGLVQQIRKSYSLSDLTECEPREDRGNDEADDVMTEPRLIRRAVKGGYSTRRSASESNSRTPMYFPEVDVDVRPRPRSDEPDFSHIKSTEDISSGYSSADNSASLTRTASLGAAARARSRTTRTTVTTIKRPQAAEGSEIIIEELRDDDGFEYANMPSLVDAPSQIYLSHTDPPFLYQYVGDQVKIIQVLGNYPINRNINIQSNDTDDWDQKETVITEVTDNPLNKDFENKNKDNIELVNREPEVNVKEIVQNDNSENADSFIIDLVDQSDSKNEPEVNIPKQTIEEENKVTDSRETPAPKLVNTDQTDSVNIQSGDNSECVEKNEKDIKELDTQQSAENIKQTNEILKEKDTPIVDKTVDDVDSADSDDEASFGTENSPKSKKKAKGKYGKSKAPLPPLEIKTIENDSNKDSKVDINVTDVTTSQESLIDIVNKLPNTPFKDTGTVKTLQVVNPIAENKRRHKSKSPGRVPKSNSSGIGRLLQLPSKLAFWNRADDKPKSDISVSSGDNSRRSSNIEQATIDEFQSCIDLTKVLTDDVQITKRKQDDEISFKDATEIDDSISNVIVEKSDALQRLIDAKLESHPEYKIVPLHEEIATTSKSTDV